ncbi:MAG: GNAT family N-acetyltransferase [Erysipelotrichaceae bacterium]|nr:GNAT family N-acetyltransferase [Erysipelotrichaceae bacterium]MDY5252004.1 GNAT family N-acetyltransferase [Erysipelotrichaceae bacterium]
MFFNFWRKKSDAPLKLEVFRIVEPNEIESVRTIYYNMVVGNRVVGICDLRFGYNEELYYAGNIGYSVFMRYRGNHYAYKACLLLLDIAKQHQMPKLWITCSPDNIASRKTIEKLDAQLLEVADVPKDHWLYKNGETIKNIYEIKV